MLVRMLKALRPLLRPRTAQNAEVLLSLRFLLLGCLPLFIGLAVVMPLLGHSTWHLYRKVVAS